MDTVLCSDIAIGDFYFISIEYKGVKYKDLLCEVKTISHDCVDVFVFGLPDKEVKIRVLISNLEHIPITSEFLERNGLTYDREYLEWISRCNKTRNVAVFAESMGDPLEQFWMIEAKSTKLSATFWCKFVDDFQHLLNLAEANFDVKP